MDPNGESDRRLARAWLRYSELRLSLEADEDWMDSDLWLALDLEDSYLVGLTTSALRVDPCPSNAGKEARNRRRLEALLSGEARADGPIKAEAIRLDLCIERGLASARPETPEGRAELVAFLKHRHEMVELALALSEATGLPLRWEPAEDPCG
jgi:hypothetical protein